MANLLRRTIDLLQSGGAPRKTRVRGNRRAVTRVSEALISGSRVVSIWGAGASIRSGVPSGAYLRDEMRSDLLSLSGTRAFRDAFGRDTDRVRMMLQKSSKELTFEYVLHVYAKLYGDHGTERLHEWLCQYIPRRLSDPDVPYLPTLSHELAAHLAGVGLFSCFISLNFDEILEKALMDELEAENVRVVASRSEFQCLEGWGTLEWPATMGPPHP